MVKSNKSQNWTSSTNKFSWIFRKEGDKGQGTLANLHKGHIILDIEDCATSQKTRETLKHL